VFLLNVNGTLYGSTVHGGKYGGGTIFSITASGDENVLHSFGGPNDGSGAISALVDIGGTLYGATGAGGANNLGSTASKAAMKTVRGRVVPLPWTARFSEPRSKAAQARPAPEGVERSSQ
jgi:uncharacterized repeat protein (TIGR03803 family)